MSSAPTPPRTGVAVVLTGHNEGTLAQHTMRSLARALRAAAEAGLSVQVIGVLDNADPATTGLFAEALGSGGVVGSLAPTATAHVAYASVGASRNHGIRLSDARHVCILDADNLISGNWLVEAVSTADAHGGPCVVRASQLVLFEGAWAVWPTLASTDPRFRWANLADHNYWDTFCLASREVFDRSPYAATSAATGFGPEDWHWNMATLEAGVPHLVAEQTAMFYRVKLAGSMMGDHLRGGSLLAPSPFLVDPDRAAEAAAEARRPMGRGEPPRALLRDILRFRRGRTTLPEPPAPLPAKAEQDVARRRRNFVDPDHYRYLYADAAGLSDEAVAKKFKVARKQGRRGWLTARELDALRPLTFNVLHYRALNHDALRLPNDVATRHYLDVGLLEGRRARLSRAEVDDLGQLHLDDYQALHTDLTHHDDLALVNHYLSYGRAENRQIRITDDVRRSMTPYVLPEWLKDELRVIHTLEPYVFAPDPHAVASVRETGPPADGLLTWASQAWWLAVDALAGRAPDAMFFVPRVRVGEADLVLQRHTGAVLDADPHAHVVVVTTHLHPTRTHLLDPRITLIDLPATRAWQMMVPHQRSRLIANFVAQFRPRMVHALNSVEFFDALERFPRPLAASTRIYLSTFVLDQGPYGDGPNPLLHRPTDYLAAVERVLVDCESLVDELHEVYRSDRDKFAVHTLRTRFGHEQWLDDVAALPDYLFPEADGPEGR